MAACALATWPASLALAASILLAAAQSAMAQPLADGALVAALRQGGYVLLMRHTRSPAASPDKSLANPDNLKLERQLDGEGRETAHAMGEALTKLGIPVGAVLSSPAYRALETVRLMGLGTAQTFSELGDAGQSMQALGTDVGNWIRLRVGERPRAGNTLIVTHQPNIAAAYGQAVAGIADGETMVFRPDGKGGAELVARVRIEDWPRLAAESAGPR